jgi:antitoxin component YwqK of YwqJK toxin-antitoxin module
LIKNFKYTYLHTNDKPIFYTSVWVETSDKENSKYFARINSIVDTTFYLTFYTIDEKKIFDGEFSSLVPLKRAGTFTFYNEDGTKRRELVYSDNKLVGGKVYFQNGDLHRSFQIEDSEMLYSTVKAANGESVLNNLGNGTEKIFR